MAVLALCPWAFAFDFSASVPGGQTLYFNLKGKGVEVTSELPAEPYYRTPLQGELSIPMSVEHDGVIYPVLSIASHAFEGCKELTSLTLSGSVTTIGREAFKDCQGLRTVTLGPSISSVGDGAFAGCKSVQTLYYNAQNCQFKSSRQDANTGLRPMAASVTRLMVGEGVRELPAEVFRGFVSIREVVLPVSLVKVGDAAFYGCTTLKNITFGGSISKIGDAAFCGCRALEVADLPHSLTSIGDKAFAHCISLHTVLVGRSLMSIGKAAFVGCSQLRSITLPKTCLHIGAGAFASGTSVQKK